MAGVSTWLTVAASMVPLTAASQDILGSYNIDPESISVSGFSSGGYMAAQLGIAYSDLFKVGFGVFAGGPYDCARDQNYTTCLFNNTPSITKPLANLYAWSGDEIDCLCNLKHRRIYLQSGTIDDTVGLGIVKLLESQLAHFTEPENVTFVSTDGAAHAFPTDLDGDGNSPCNESASPYIADCGYDGAGAVLGWLYGRLNDRRTGTISGTMISFAQSGDYGAPGMAGTAYLYVPVACQSGNKSRCKLHVALHGCTMNYESIGARFLVNTGYNLWADTNDMIVVYPQTTVDNATYPTWSGELANPTACWDYIGQYGESDWRGANQMEAIVNMVRRISSGHGECSRSRSHASLSNMRANQRWYAE